MGPQLTGETMMKFREITEEQARELNTNFLVMWEYDDHYWYQTGFFSDGRLKAYDCNAASFRDRYRKTIEAWLTTEGRL